MPDQDTRSTRDVPLPRVVVCMCCATLALLLSSCSASLPVQHEARLATQGELSVAYSIVFIIHGDGDYLYHDTSDNEYQADEETLAGAKRVAQQNPRAEVFIFHQEPKRHFLFVFPLHDGEFFYYRNGLLIAHESYWRDQDLSHLEPEVGLYRRFHTDTLHQTMSMFLYYGHEIPEFGGAGYDASYPERTFTVHDLADGLQGFTDRPPRFDLMILSTCFGGTPYTISALGPFARYIIASPDNLHLSYFDLHPLERLDLRDGGMAAFAQRFARRAFDRLTGNIQTAVSVAVYDVDRVQGFLRSVHSVYDHPTTTITTMEHCDCADLPAYKLKTIAEGVEVFYRPARFGRSHQGESHSGWECWKERGLQAATSEGTVPAVK